MVAPATCIVVTQMKPVVRMRLGSGQTVELSMGGLLILRYTVNNVRRNRRFGS